MDRRLIIADINSANSNGICSGHYIPVARMYKELFKDYIKVVVAGGPIYQKYFDTTEILNLPYNVNGVTIKDRIKNIQNCRELFSQSKGDIIVMQQCRDVITYLAIILFYHKKSKLFLIRYSDKSLKNPISNCLYQLCRRKIDGIICPSQELGKIYEVNYLSIPDYIFIEDNKKKLQTIPFSKKIYDFSMIGRIAPGKGVIEAAKKMANTPYKILIAGKPENSQLQKELIVACNNASNIELHLGYVDDEDYLRYRLLSKYSILNYEAEYSIRSSGAVFDSLFSGIPVVGKKCEALSFVSEQKLGYIYNDLEEFDPSSVLSEKLYEIYKSNIIHYKEKHKEYQKLIVNFILE